MRIEKCKIVFVCVFILFLCSPIDVGGQNKNKNFVSYIDKYRDLAIDNMNRYKIPASITLAQGLLESGAGTSYLAKNANNHFGIKCGNWTGKSVSRDDDAKNECFRKYKNAGESYNDHGRFLAERNIYSRLFLLEMTDYKAWAKGLSDCGYATDKQYPNKLINLIELYELYRFDSKYFFPRDVYKNFGLIYVVAEDNDSFRSIASDLGFKEKNLIKYNEYPSGYKLRKGDIVYLENKRKKAEKPHYDYIVRPGESMHSISQKYGVRLSNLYKMNKMSSTDFIPKTGTILRLR